MIGPTVDAVKQGVTKVLDKGTRFEKTVFVKTVDRASKMARYVHEGKKKIKIPWKLRRGFRRQNTNSPKVVFKDEQFEQHLQDRYTTEGQKAHE